MGHREKIVPYFFLKVFSFFQLLAEEFPLCHNASVTASHSGSRKEVSYGMDILISFFIAVSSASGRTTISSR